MPNISTRKTLLIPLPSNNFFTTNPCIVKNCERTRNNYLDKFRVSDSGIIPTSGQVYMSRVIQSQFSTICLWLSSSASCRKYSNGGISCISNCLGLPQSPQLPGFISSATAKIGLPPYEYLHKGLMRKECCSSLSRENRVKEKNREERQRSRENKRYDAVDKHN